MLDDDGTASGPRGPARPDGPDASAAGPRPLIVTDDELVLDDLLRVAAAAGVDVDHQTAPGTPATWRAAPVVFVDAAAAGRMVAAGLPRRPAVIAVAAQPPDDQQWHHCLQLGVEQVIELDTGARADQQLLTLFAESARPGSGDGRTVAVIGGCGGAGASVLAVAIAVASVRERWPTLLVDCDPGGAGLDVLTGVESASGLRWDDIRVTHGTVSTSAIRAAVPAAVVGRDRLPVLCPDRDRPVPVDPDAVAAVLAAGRRTGGVTVVDVPRCEDPAGERVLALADLVVLMVPSDVRATYAARRLLPRLQRATDRAGVVVRGPAPGSITASEVVDALGLPLLGTIRALPLLGRDLDHARLPGADPGAPLGRVARALVQMLVGDGTAQP
ncbi:septum site-determining protein Ssd [Nakamurella leprariae]|uniref:Rv3660c-like CheY-like N-terminal domain-containing protein n=1 Tax=Nakamurella leprariae TaxID=2803911 RepID=A0A938YB67_9ACTN|nr:septum site-determining protein Ssd [Nakamurella leprariae]MBM9467402.1 hypothetical protein [Nakamurella leprariae]